MIVDPGALPRRIAGLTGLLLIAIPPAFVWWVIHHFGVNAAYWDHLIDADLFERYYSGTLSLEYLTRPHLEHIKLFPRLVGLGLGIASRFDNLVEMYAQWGLLVATAIVLYVAFSRRVGRGWIERAILFAPVMFVLFNLQQQESLLSGDGMITYLAIAATTTTLCVLADTDAGGRGFAAAVCLAVIASFSHAAGLLVWPIGLLVLVLPRAATGVRRARVVTCIAVAALALAVYAARWPDGSPGMSQYGNVNLRNALTYAIGVAGVPFTGRAGAQVAFGIAVLLLECLVLACGLRDWVRRRVPLGVWLIAFATGCGLLFTFGRAYGGGGPAPRYAAFMGMGVIGLYLTAQELAFAGAAGATLVRNASLALIVAGVPLGIPDALHAATVARNERLRIAQLLATTSIQNDQTLERLLYPRAEHARIFAHVLERRRLNIFAATPVDPAILPSAPDRAQFFVDAINGVLPARPLTLSVAAAETIGIAGWALDRVAQAPLRTVFLLVDHERRIPAAYGLHRPDVAQALHNRAYTRTGFEAGFSAGALPPGRHELALLFVSDHPPAQTVTETLAIVDRR